ncbi:VOC family protein [Kaistia geumhonensis]|uniref:Catechol 2,3-dioxygenase-like lactoylglutathione lyase family enzyme n=1 Tax=Kaistia geumhonensis TaxID=410839 RepID=A0ABU0M6M9_9HYPH|nr:VOC family protein [Kaistia geumhonensis]MCX5478159.1 VOC family protein [Kaistia geumhonensis]MDQ0516625.1 catechol 2,3-dioxygenase-like lactoylglutathione lyase family enzyme [Kaistia geumhonensis]
MIRIARLDHLVLTVGSIEASIRFYRDVLGMEEITFAAGRKALRFGRQQINLHEAGREFEPKAARPAPGSADLCFIVETPLDALAAHLARSGIAIELGPVPREGASGAFTSLYFRDPDGNLVELSVLAAA